MADARYVIGYIDTQDPNRTFHEGVPPVAQQAQMQQQAPYGTVYIGQNTGQNAPNYGPSVPPNNIAVGLGNSTSPNVRYNYNTAPVAIGEAYNPNYGTSTNNASTFWNPNDVQVTYEWMPNSQGQMVPVRVFHYNQYPGSGAPVRAGVSPDGIPYASTPAANTTAVSASNAPTATPPASLANTSTSTPPAITGGKIVNNALQSQNINTSNAPAATPPASLANTSTSTPPAITGGKIVNNALQSQNINTTNAPATSVTDTNKVDAPVVQAIARSLGVTIEPDTELTSALLEREKRLLYAQRDFAIQSDPENYDKYPPPTRAQIVTSAIKRVSKLQDQAAEQFDAETRRMELGDGV